MDDYINQAEQLISKLVPGLQFKNGRVSDYPATVTVTLQAEHPTRKNLSPTSFTRAGKKLNALSAWGIPSATNKSQHIVSYVSLTHSAAVCIKGTNIGVLSFEVSLKK